MATSEKSPIRILSENRQAWHNYYLSDRLEAGLVLSGTEVKAARAGKVQLRDAYAEVDNHEAWLVNAHISEYSHGNRFNHEPTRRRKLLLHRREIEKLSGKIQQKGLTILPTKLYLKGGLVKVELAVGQGKKLHDKREVERKRTQEAEAKAGLARNQR
ncbi:MAG: SsrA-binding protein SmpB [Bryobacteraceae bacterium]|nr:SsrA-binding protein SmpB [Bryobacteraceae bacterium]MDW8377137.1 SsrA-binding protein SmpB [Bryobacterales bacterium]